MISTWNVRGINKEERHKADSSYLYVLNVPIVALLETRVKQVNANKIRRAFGNNWPYLDKYSHHRNGRIWLIWKDQEVKIKELLIEEQFIHVEIFVLANKIMYYATIVYAYNQIEKRKTVESN